METYNGHVRTPQDAIILFEACRLGLLPRVQRRLSEKERSQIKSGSVFVWDEREAGMRRWTDGKSWSASRVSGSFLTYREMEGKRGSNGSFQTSASRTKSGGAKSSNGSQNGDSDEGDEGPDGYRYKPDGLMKQSFSITTQDGRHLHLISYYNRSHVPPLKSPSTDPQLRNITPPKGMYPENAVNEPTTMTPIGRPQIPAGSYPVHPPAGLVVAYPWPPGYPPPPGAIAYPAPAWPPSPSATPPHHYTYPHPGYAHAAYPPPSLAHFSHPGQHPLERLPPTPQNCLPTPQSSTNSNSHSAPSGWPPARSPGAPPYQHPPHPPLHPIPYSSTQPPSSGATLAPVMSSFHKPPSPPAVNATKPFTEPPPLKDIPATNDTSPANKIIPSITALINGPQEARDTPVSRSGSRSPGRVTLKDVPNAMTVTGLQRDRGDLKKLDSQLLKGKS
ncbi:uncharacterized protein PV09_03584 [Verruconis gallopava]|uniref:cAMP-independent regulatory protein pac2 n=1 Tax=Verruconis gallopava TaxID=253628 RepID=A0A0D1YYE1_9PEZI|nr:uncharacterized protein PV09_03584 [Verruconis gallopava]KIW05727.1 hypothetical protein PV09_03584 [Verruconis gallopava]